MYPMFENKGFIAPSNSPDVHNHVLDVSGVTGIYLVLRDITYLHICEMLLKCLFQLKYRML